MAFVIYTNKLQRAVDAVIAPGGYSVDQDTAPSGRSTLKEGFAIDSSGGGYSGDFAVSATPQYNANGSVEAIILSVANGLHPDSEQYAWVNGEAFFIPPWKSSPITPPFNVYVRLKYTPRGADDVGNGTSPSKAKIEVEVVKAEDSAMDDTVDNAFYMLARVEYTSLGIRIVQHHLLGSAIFYHISLCPADKYVSLGVKV